jgi:hypothetical protein
MPGKNGLKAHGVERAGLDEEKRPAKSNGT